MKRIIIIGCPGSGKSTFARGLRDATGLPLHYLDMLWHRPDGTNISREEFDVGLSRILEGDGWIIDGNYQRTLGRRLVACDTVFLFDIPLEDCLEGARSRIGRPREDMPWVEREFDGEFEQCIRDFPQNTLPAIYELLENYKECREVVIFHSRREADAYLAAIK